MKFESYNSDQENKEEVSIEQERKSRFSRIEKYLRVAVVMGVLSVSGKYFLEGIKNIKEYNDHIESFSPERKDRCEELRSKLVEIIGEDKVRKIENGDKYAFTEKMKEEIERQEKENSTEIHGFDKIGIDNEKLKKIWIEDSISYPKKWIEEEISYIEYKDEEKIIDEKYGDNLKNKNSSASFDSINRSIIFSKKPEGEINALTKEDLISFFDSVFSHESGHANDWEEDKEMELDERYELVLKIINRLKSEDGLMRTNYVSSIKNSDPKMEIYMKAKEYWATICSSYFQYPVFLKMDYPKDFEIVDEFVKKQDSDFNPIESSKHRRFSYKD